MADLVLHGGRVVTLDARSTVAEAMAIAGDRITAVGADAAMLSLTGPQTRRIDLRGRTVIPGLIDAHAHLDREGLKAVYPSLAGATSIDDVLQRIEALARDTEPGGWIVTMPIGEPPEYLDVPNNLKERRFPTRWELDRVSPRNPVYIRALWGYWRHTLPLVSIANSEALRRAAVTAETLPPWAGIQIDKVWATGEPNGVFIEWTYMPVVELSLMACVPRFTHAHRVGALRDSMRIYNATGTTGVFEGHGIADEVRAVYREVAAAGQMTVRAHLMMSPPWRTRGAQPPAAQIGEWAPMLGGRGTGDAFLRVGGVFAEGGVLADNVVRARAWPYTGWAGFAHDTGLPREQLREVLIAAARHDVRVGGIQRDLLDLYAEVDQVVPIRDRRWVLEHISVLTDEEIHRIRDLGLIVTTHTNSHIGKQGEIHRKRVGPEAEDTIVPLRKLRDAGVTVALATDNVPTSLFHPIAQTVTRLDRYAKRAIAPSQALTREEALRAATAGAWLTFEEREKGTLEPGKLADLAVLSADPLTIDAAEIAGIVADITVVGGRVVFER